MIEGVGVGGNVWDESEGGRLRRRLTQWPRRLATHEQPLHEQ